MDTVAIWPVGQWLNPTDTITSANKQFELVMQDDGNLVIYSIAATRTPVWSSNTVGHPGAKARFQDDGNVVVYKPDGVSPLWASNSAGHPAPSATLTDAGALVVGDPSAPAWQSGSIGDKASQTATAAQQAAGQAAVAAEQAAAHATDAVKGLFSKFTGKP